MSFNPLSILGGLFGAASSGDKTQTVNRDPWAPAQPYLLSNIDSASKLQNYYQQNPLSELQQRAYNNSFLGNDGARQGLSMLSSQLGQNQGWSRNSGPRLPQGYGFLPIGATVGGTGNAGGVSSGTSKGGGGLPVNPFSGSGIVTNTPKAYMPPALPINMMDTANRGGGGFGGDGGLNPGNPNSAPDTTSAASKAVSGLVSLTGIPSMMNTVNTKAAAIGLPGYVAPNTPGHNSIDGGGYTGSGGTTSATGGGIAANPMGLDPAQAQGQGGGGGGGGDKIICTAMNEAYGFGSYRQAIWLKYSERMTKQHERGYHKLFLPLVKYAFHSGDGFGKRIVRKVLEHGTRHRTADLRAEMYGRKRDTLGRIYRAIFEPLCYVAGKA